MRINKPNSLEEAIIEAEKTITLLNEQFSDEGQFDYGEIDRNDALNMISTISVLINSLCEAKNKLNEADVFLKLHLKLCWCNNFSEQDCSDCKAIKALLVK